MHSSIQGKSVLITGAGRGIGKRLAMGFAEAGARVGLLARSQGQLDLAVLEIAQAGGAAIGLRADVCDPDQLAVAVAQFREVAASPSTLRTTERKASWTRRSYRM